MLIVPPIVSKCPTSQRRVFVSVGHGEIYFVMSDKNKYSSEEAGEHGYDGRNYIFTTALAALLKKYYKLASTASAN